MPPSTWCTACYWPEALGTSEATRALKDLLTKCGCRRSEVESYDVESCGRTIAAWKAGCEWPGAGRVTPRRTSSESGEVPPSGVDEEVERTRAFARAWDTERLLGRARAGRLAPEEGVRAGRSRSRSPSQGGPGNTWSDVRLTRFGEGREASSASGARG